MTSYHTYPYFKLAYKKRAKLTRPKSSRINNLVKLRYNQLKSNIFSEEYLYKLIDTYYDEINYDKTDNNEDIESIAPEALNIEIPTIIATR